MHEYRHHRSACLPHLMPLSRIGLAKQAARRVRLAHFTSLLLGRAFTVDEAYRLQEAHVMSDLYDCQIRIEDGESYWLWRGEGDGRYFLSVDERGDMGEGCLQRVRNGLLDTWRERAWFAEIPQ